MRWTVDSGATVHTTNNFNVFTHFYEDQVPIHLQVADNRLITVNKIGNASINIYDETGNKRQIVLHNVCYHPKLSNLLSVRRLRTDSNLKCIFDKRCYLQCTESLAKYFFEYKNKYLIHTIYSAVLNTFSHLHSRFGHASSKRLKKLSTQARNLS